MGFPMDTGSYSDDSPVPLYLQQILGTRHVIGTKRNKRAAFWAAAFVPRQLGGQFYGCCSYVSPVRQSFPSDLNFGELRLILLLRPCTARARFPAGTRFTTRRFRADVTRPRCPRCPHPCLLHPGLHHWLRADCHRHHDRRRKRCRQRGQRRALHVRARRARHDRL